MTQTTSPAKATILSVLSPDTTRSAILAANNRLSIYSTASNSTTFVSTKPIKPLSTLFTSAAWQPTNESHDLIAFGTNHGGILLWDTKLGKIFAELPNPESSKNSTQSINDIVFDPSGKFLYSCSSESSIIQWSVEQKKATGVKLNGDKDGVRKLAISPSGAHLASANIAIKLWNLSSITSRSKPAARFVGEPNSVADIAFADEEYIVSCSAEGNVNSAANLWKIVQSDDQVVSPIAILTNDTPIHHLEVSLRSETSRGGKKGKKRRVTKSFDIVGISQTGIVSLWNFSAAGSQGAPTSISPSGIVGVSDDQNIDIAKFSKNRDGYIVVAYGGFIKPHFKELKYIEENAIIANIELDSTKSLKTIKDSKTPSTTASATNAIATPIVESKPKEVKEKEADLAEAEKDSIETLQQKLDLLKTPFKSEPEVDEVSAGIAKLGGITSVLVQALHSKDQKQIEDCLLYLPFQNVSIKGSKNSKNTQKFLRQQTAKIDQTILELPPSIAPTLLSVISEKLFSRHKGGERAIGFKKLSKGGPSKISDISFILIRWMKSLLIHHASVLSASKENHAILALLHNSIREQLSSYSDLLQLSGRLTILASYGDKTGSGLTFDGKAQAVKTVNLKDLSNLNDALGTAFDDDDDEDMEDIESDDEFIDDEDEDEDEDEDQEIGDDYVDDEDELLENDEDEDEDDDEDD